MAYSSCTCGKRFPLAANHGRKLARHLGPVGFESAEGALIGAQLEAELQRVWPSTKVCKWAKQGVAPVGTAALHCSAYAVGELGRRVQDFGNYMMQMMQRANGVGLASNQLGVRLRVLVHELSDAAPPVLVNPWVLRSGGTWSYGEGCLSLQIEGTYALVDRPRRLLVRAYTMDGSRVVLEADELLARILQHELDHLDGIEYVQRLTGDERDRVYDVMRNAGVDLSLMPSIQK